MKKYIVLTSILISGFVFGQVTIGKTTNSNAPANASVSLELGDATLGTKGIVLPWVLSAADVTNPVAGTLIFDSADKKIKYRNNTTIWFDLSAGALIPGATVGVPDTNLEVSTSKTQIGGLASDTTPGILVLADTNKAMILPRVSSYTAITNPSPGMMVYVTTTNQLAVYNGSEWAFWTKQ